MIVNVKINKPFDGYLTGQMVKIEVDSKGKAIEKLWRRRLKDAEIDKCCEIIKGWGTNDDDKSTKRNSKYSKRKQRSRE